MLKRMGSEQVHLPIYVVLLRGGTDGCGDPDANRGSPARPGDDLQLSRDQMRTFFHADESEAAAVPARRLEVEPLTVINDGQLDIRAGSGDRHPESSRVAMDGPVSECFLSDSKKRELDFGADPPDVAVRLEAHLHIMPLLDFAAV